MPPHIDKTSFAAQGIWELVADCADFKKDVAPKLRAQWYDVRTALGQDTRFTGEYALAKYEDGVVYEAPPGYSKIDDGKFFISQYLVTVAQFDAFKQSAEFKALAKSKPKQIRAETPEWAKQIAFLNRPVVNVNWYEASAYAEWLQSLLVSGELGDIKVQKGYVLRLPMDTEWDQAARGGLVGKDYPWGDQVEDIGQQANVNMKVGNPTTVGSYDHNKFGLFDMAGNVWEWQANEYENGGKSKSLRGGSWLSPPVKACCSSRCRLLPDVWSSSIGFRLVLSLADFES